MPPLTSEQTAVSDNIAIAQATSCSAVAGSGKTFTAVHGLRRVSIPTLACAFNVSIKRELEARLADSPAVTCKTLNGLGHSLWGKHLRKPLQLDTDKTRKIVSQLMSGQPFDDIRNVCILVDAARTHGLVTTRWRGSYKGLLPDEDSAWMELAEGAEIVSEKLPDIIRFARRALDASIASANGGSIDFTDQIYMPAITGCKIEGFGLIVVDEAQDLNPLQHVILSNARGASVVSIGDPHQSIYGFRGAVQGSMDKLAAKFSMESLGLTCCFRCDKAIVQEAQAYVKHIRYDEAALPGEVSRLPFGWQISELPPNATILCRYNAPLLKLCFEIIRAGQRPNFLGRDVGKSLSALIRSALASKSLDTPIAEMLTLLEAFVKQKTDEAIALGQEGKIQTLTDKYQSVLAFLEWQHYSLTSDLLQAIADFFSNQLPGDFTLASIHRSKGLEWPTVVYLNSGSTPGARVLRQLEAGNTQPYEQEMNLKYVATTRAQHKLVYAER